MNGIFVNRVFSKFKGFFKEEIKKGDAVFRAIFAKRLDHGVGEVVAEGLDALVGRHDVVHGGEGAVRIKHLQAQVVGVEGAKHLWVGEKYVRIVLDALVAHLVPGAAPLPDDYDGPMERWSDL